MRITAVKCILVSAPYASSEDAERTRHLKTGFRPAAFIKIETDEEVYGLGETYAGVFAPEVVRETVAQFEYDLLNEDPLNTLELWDRIRAAFASRNCSILELSHVPNPLRDELLVEPLNIVDGRLQAPTTPGLGVYLPEDLFEKYPYRPGSVYRILGN